MFFCFVSVEKHAVNERKGITKNILRAAAYRALKDHASLSEKTAISDPQEKMKVCEHI